MTARLFFAAEKSLYWLPATANLVHMRQFLHTVSRRPVEFSQKGTCSLDCGRQREFLLIFHPVF